jgi:hypothetical protein
MKVLCLKNDEKKKLGKILLGKFLLSSCRVCFAPYAFISPLTHGSAAVA